MTAMDDLPKFKASDGREIALLPGWFQNKVNIGWPHGIKDFKTFVETCMALNAPYPKTFMFFLNKLITANSMKCLFEENGVRLDGTARLLDVCTGPAVLPRAFKALGWCGEAHGVDITDRRDDFTDEEFRRIWKEGRDATYSEDLNFGIPIFDLYQTMNSLQTGLTNCFDALFSFDDIKSGGLMDSYTVGDFLAYEPRRKFDLVTLTCGMEYFDANQFFAKLSGIMEAGGVFATFNDYFYELYGASMNLPMEAPWLHARLSKPDLLRYYEEFHPDIAGHAKRAFYFPTTHFTVRDFIRTAGSHGLELISYRRTIQTYAVKNFFYINPFLRDYFFNCVLPDCRAINDTVSADDLFTNYLTMVFRKAA